MRSIAGYLDMVSTYVDRIATAKDDGKWVATHGTQQPLEILEAMDVMSCELALLSGRPWDQPGCAVSADP